MTKEAIETRLAKLEREREQLVLKIEQLTGNVNAYNGAIEESRYWLSQLPKDEV